MTHFRLHMPGEWKIAVFICQENKHAQVLQRTRAMGFKNDLELI